MEKSKQTETTLQIEALEYEISCIQVKAWKTGVDIIDLQAKQVQLAALKENLKSEKLC